MDFTFPMVSMKGSQKLDKYLDLAWELKKLFYQQDKLLCLGTLRKE